MNKGERNLTIPPTLSPPLLQQTAPHTTVQPLTGPDLEEALNRIHYCLFAGDRQRVRLIPFLCYRLPDSIFPEQACQEAMRAGLWSHAMVIASQLGPAAFQDVQKQFAVCALVEGSPLRTLYLMFAKQPGGTQKTFFFFLFSFFLLISDWRV